MSQERALKEIGVVAKKFFASLKNFFRKARCSFLHKSVDRGHMPMYSGLYTSRASTTAGQWGGKHFILKEEPMATSKSAKKAAKKETQKKENPAKKVPPVKAPMTKAAMLDEIAGNTGLNKKQVASVFDELTTLIERHIKKGAVGQFALPGIMKIEIKRKPATKARKGINPFTGEETIFKAKPARNVVKIRPLKKIKDMVSS